MRRGQRSTREHRLDLDPMHRPWARALERTIRLWEVPRAREEVRQAVSRVLFWADERAPRSLASLQRLLNNLLGSPPREGSPRLSQRRIPRFSCMALRYPSLSGRNTRVR